MGKKLKNAKLINIKLNEKKRSMLCIILKEGKGSKWRWLDDNEDEFSIDGNTYFKQDEGTYLNGYIRIMVYLEGISLPVNHGLIEHEELEKTVKSKVTGKEKKVKVTKIKGLKFDSKIIDMMLNRGLTDAFTKQHMDLPNLAIIILLIASLIVGIINIAMWFA